MIYSEFEVRYIKMIHDLCNNDYINFHSIKYAFMIDHDKIYDIFKLCKRLKLLKPNTINGFDFDEDNYNLWCLFNYSPQYMEKYKARTTREKFEKSGYNFEEIDIEDDEDEHGYIGE